MQHKNKKQKIMYSMLSFYVCLLLHRALLEKKNTQESGEQWLTPGKENRYLEGRNRRQTFYCYITSEFCTISCTKNK